MCDNCVEILLYSLAEDEKGQPMCDKRHVEFPMKPILQGTYLCEGDVGKNYRCDYIPIANTHYY